MAATCCNLTQVSGFKKLNEYLQVQSHFKRCHLSSKRSTSSVEKVFHRTYKGQLQVQRWHQYLLHVPCARGAELSSSSFEDVGEEIQEDISKETLIWRAIKLPIYSVAVVPLTVGSAAAYLQTGTFSARTYLVLLASSVLVITWLNLSNDVYDFDTGVDKNKKESVVNLVGRNLHCCLLMPCSWPRWADLGCCCGRKHALNIVSYLCSYLWLYISVSTISVKLPGAGGALMLCSICGMNYCPLSGTVLSVSILVGFTTSLILFCSHFHQVEGDKEVGKMSPLVRLGTKRGAEVVKVAVLMLYALLVAFGLSKALPLTCIFLCTLTLPMGNLVVRFVQDNHKDKNKIFMAKYFCVRLHALFGAALASGLVLARMVNTTFFTSRPIFS